MNALLHFRKILKKDKNEVPDRSAQIVLSESWIVNHVPAPFKQRIRWLLRFKIPSLCVAEFLKVTYPFGFLAVLLVSADWYGVLGWSFVFHPVFLCDALVALVLSVLFAVAFCFLNIIFLCLSMPFYASAASRRMDGLRFPQTLKLHADRLDLGWTKLLYYDRWLSIPFSWIDRVSVREYVNYYGLCQIKVLELGLKEIPASFFQRSRLKKLTGYYLDPALNKLAPKPPIGMCIRLPLPLFAFERDAAMIVDAISAHVGDDVVDADIRSALKSTSDIESYTALWLTELHARPAQTLDRTLSEGHQLKNGAYTITRVIGQGGLAIVYEAKVKNSDSHDQLVAIKQIVFNFGGTKQTVESHVKQVLNEVDVLRKLDHPKIVKFNEFFIEGNCLYIVIEAVPGSNLRHYVLQHEKLDEQELTDILLQCCSVLDYLHSQPEAVLHRDFTPDNLMLSDGLVKVIDFNVAQKLIASSSSTVIGEHCFMAPEQFCGEYTVAGDLYQLGTTMYFLATGEDPEPLTQCDLALKRRDLSARFVSIVSALTEREPDKRMASARDIIEVFGK